LDSVTLISISAAGCKGRVELVDFFKEGLLLGFGVGTAFGITISEKNRNLR
jgi:hypothetical protein